MKRRWSIGIYRGESPTELYCPPDRTHAVLSAEDVTDTEALFVADPFLIRRDDIWYLFFEIMDAATRRGVIGLAESRDLFRWDYRRIVLDEPFHLSYPHVFEANGDYYMVLETLARGCISLYKADPFPEKWRFCVSLISGHYADPAIVRHDDNWWLFACGAPYTHDELRLFFAPHLDGPWSEHPASPLVSGDPRIARPAGRIVSSGGKLLRFTQDCTPSYGTSVRAFCIDGLSPSQYAEHELGGGPVLGPGVHLWNSHGMHHVGMPIAFQRGGLPPWMGGRLMSVPRRGNEFPV